MHPRNIFALAYEKLWTGVLLLEKETGRVMEVNPAFLRMCGRTRDRVLDYVFWEPPLISDAAAGAELCAHLRANGPVEAVELPLETEHAGRLLVSVSSSEFSSRAILLEVRDATRLASARLADRMGAQRSLATRAAGEFMEMRRALLTGGDAGEIRKAADQADTIIRELRAYGGQSELDLVPLQLNDVMEDMQSALRQMLGPGIRLQMQLARDVAPVMADAAQVRQILVKLAANAGEAMESGGRLRIATRNAMADDPVLARIGDHGAYAVLEISDEGPGLDDESWEHLYEPFFTTRQGGKLGLGLAAVHGTVHQMGGRLWANSEPGKGATFRAYLPRVDRALAARKAVDAEPHVPATILLMEHHDGLRTVVTNILKKRGYRVLAARAATEAVAIATSEGLPDLLICGPEPDLVRRIAILQPRLRTLYLTSRSDRAVGDALSRPFELETLLGKVRELLNV